MEDILGPQATEQRTQFSHIALGASVALLRPVHGPAVRKRRFWEMSPPRVEKALRPGVHGKTVEAFRENIHALVQASLRTIVQRFRRARYLANLEAVHLDSPANPTWQELTSDAEPRSPP